MLGGVVFANPLKTLQLVRTCKTKPAQKLPRMDLQLGEFVRSAAADVHAQLGGGLSECVYQAALALALRQRGCGVETEMVVPVSYNCQYIGFVRPDIVVNKQLVIEVKAVQKITESHFSQTRAYLRWLPLPPPSYERIIDSTQRGAVVNFGYEQVEVCPVSVPDRIGN